MEGTAEIRDSPIRSGNSPNAGRPGARFARNANEAEGNKHDSETGKRAPQRVPVWIFSRAHARDRNRNFLIQALPITSMSTNTKADASHLPDTFFVSTLVDRPNEDSFSIDRALTRHRSTFHRCSLAGSDRSNKGDIYLGPAIIFPDMMRHEGFWRRLFVRSLTLLTR